MAVDVDDVASVLRRLLDGHGHTDLFCGARAVADEPIHPGEQALYVGEHGPIDARARRATATGRALARQVLHSFGVNAGPLLRRSGGQCAWPVGVVGSIAHDDDVAVCVAGAGVDVAFGVDIEPALPLPAEIKNDVAVTTLERAAVGADLVAARLLFCAKEAVFKACFPLDEVFLEHGDVALVDAAPWLPRTSTATFTTSTKRTVHVTMTRAPRLLAFARVDFS